jgi:hypothetical protein
MPNHCKPAKSIGSGHIIETVRAFSWPEPLPEEGGSSRRQVVATYLEQTGIIPAMIATINMHRGPGYSPDNQSWVHDRSIGFQGGRMPWTILVGSREGLYDFELEAREVGGTLCDPIYKPLIEEPGYRGGYPSAQVVAADGSQRTFGQQRDEDGFRRLGEPGDGDPEVLVAAMRLFAADLINFTYDEHVC